MRLAAANSPFYENGILVGVRPCPRVPSIYQSIKSSLLPSLPQQSLWLPHGSLCPSPEQKPQSPPPPPQRPQHHDILLGLLAIIFVLVLIVVLIAAIVILADRIKTLWRETKCDVERGAAGVGSGGLFISSSWGRRVRRREHRTRTTT